MEERHSQASPREPTLPWVLSVWQNVPPEQWDTPSTWCRGWAVLLFYQRCRGAPRVGRGWVIGHGSRRPCRDRSLQVTPASGGTATRCLGTEVTGNGSQGWCHHCTSLSFSPLPGQAPGVWPQSWTGSDQAATQRCKIFLSAPCCFPVKPTWCTAAHLGSSGLCDHTPALGTCCAKSLGCILGVPKVGKSCPQPPTLTDTKLCPEG